MHIDYPTDSEREASIAAILAAGLEPKPSLVRELCGLCRAIGLRGVLSGVGDCVLLAVLLAGCAGFPLLAVLLKSPASPGLLYPLTACAPLLYAALLLLTFWKEKQLGTQELKMTVRYDLRQLTAMRLVLFSGIGALGDALFAAIAAAHSQDALLFAQLLSLSLGALFLYVTLTLAGLLYLPARVQALLPAFWCILCALPPFLTTQEQLEGILSGLPLAGSGLLAFGALGAALLLARAYLLSPRSRRPYAYC